MSIEGASQLFSITPIRVESFLTISDNQRYFETSLKQFVNLHPEIQDKARMRTHFGSLAQNRIVLSSVGIPVDVLPFNNHGELTIGSHQEWIKQRLAIEGNQYPNETLHMTTISVSDPSSMLQTEGCSDHVVRVVQDADVLPGVQRAAKFHPGNLKYQELLDGQFEVYDVASTNRRKFGITQHIVDHVHASGGRFLVKRPASSCKDDHGELPSTSWGIMSDEEARRKVSMAFRDRRKGAVARKHKKGDGDWP